MIHTDGTPTIAHYPGPANTKTKTVADPHRYARRTGDALAESHGRPYGSIHPWLAGEVRAALGIRADCRGLNRPDALIVLDAFHALAAYFGIEPDPPTN